MADLPITSDQGSQPVSLIDPESLNDVVVAADGSLIASIGTSAGKTIVMKPGTLVTTTTTVDQVVLTYTVTAAKTFYLGYFDFHANFTVLPGNNNPIEMGEISLESPAGTKLYTVELIHNAYDIAPVVLPEPIPVASGVVIRVVCTPDTATSITWRTNFGGYEK